MSRDEPVRSILVIGQHPDLTEKAATQLRSAGFHVDVIGQWFRDLPKWASGTPDLVIAHAEGPSDRFGLCQLLGKFATPPQAVSIASGPSTVPGCSYSLRYPLKTQDLDLVVRAALRGQALAALQLIPNSSLADGADPDSAPDTFPPGSSAAVPLSSREISPLDSAEHLVEFKETPATPTPSRPSVSLSNAPIVAPHAPPGLPLSSSALGELSAGPGAAEDLPPPPPFSGASDYSEPIDSHRILPVSDAPTSSGPEPEATLDPQPVPQPHASEPAPSEAPDSVAPVSLAPFEKITDDDDDVTPLTSYAIEVLPSSAPAESPEAPVEASRRELSAEELIAAYEVARIPKLVADAPAPSEDEVEEPEAELRPDSTPGDDETSTESERAEPPMRTWLKKSAAVDTQGDLRGFRLADLLHHCAMQVKTGIITLTREGHRKRIYLQQGAPVYVDSLLREETLGAFLLKREVITEEQHRIAIAKMSGTSKRLGEVLIDMGVLKAKEAYRHLNEHIQSKVISAFGWTEGQYTLKELPRLPAEIMGVPMNAPNLVVQGLRAHFNPDHLPADFPASESTGGLPVESPAYAPEELSLSATANRIREELEAGTSVDSLCEVVGAPIEQVMGVAYALYVLQVIGFSNRPGRTSAGRPIDAESSASISLDGGKFETFNDVCDAFLADYLRLRPLDCFRVLGLHPDDDDDDDDDAVRIAFEGLRDRLHPEVFDPVEIQPVRIKVDELWAQIYDARKTLATAAGRAAYRQVLAEAHAQDAANSGTRGPEQQKALAGESHFLEGRRALSAGEFADALAAFDRALEASPKEPAYLAHRAWTMYTSDPRAHRQHAIAELNTTRSLDSSYPGVSYFLGRICLDDGANDIALGYFEMALRADPDFREAQQYRQLTKSKIFAARNPAPAPKKEGGRLSRLFKRKK